MPESGHWSKKYSWSPESCWRRCCRDDVGLGAMLLPSHTGDGVVKMTWPRRDVGAESC
jgi:hypothetical protein